MNKFTPLVGLTALILATSANADHTGTPVNVGSCSGDVGLLDENGVTCTSTITATAAGTFLHTINFDVADPHTLFHMTSSSTGGILGFGASIFENEFDSQVYASATSFTEIDLPDGVIAGNGVGFADYHLHPSGFLPAAGTYSYTITMWAESTAPVPEASTYGMMLAGLGLVGFAARRRVR
ncbi:MAG: FxDxF family PEP-CTERM protein [Thiobacillus sp.]